MQDYNQSMRDINMQDNNFSGENNGKVYQIDERKNCNNVITVKKISMYQELSEEELQRRKQRYESKRYGLQSKLGHVIKCIAILTDHVSVSKEDNVARYTLLNIVDKETNEFLSDHMQINKEKVDKSISKKYRDDKLCFVEIIGEVEKYGKDDDRIAVDISKSNSWYIKRIDGSFTKTYVGDSSKADLSDIERIRINSKLQYKDDYEIEQLIHMIKSCINDFTRPNNIPDDYLYNYIIHQYLVNKHHKDIFIGKLPSRLNINNLVEILHLTNYTYVILEKLSSSDIVTILKLVSLSLCSFMGYENNKRYKECDGISLFANKMNVKWFEVKDIIDYMIKDFKLIDLPIIPKDEIITTSINLMSNHKLLYKLD